MSRFLLLTVAIVSLVALPTFAEAAIVSGTLDISGSVTVTNAGIIDWGSNGAADGTVLVANTSTGTFVPYIGSFGTEKDLNQAVQIAALPPGGFSLDLFETVGVGSALPDIDFVLNDLLTCQEIASGTCQAGLTSPFSFEQSGAGTIANPFSVQVTLRMSGTVFDTATPTLISLWNGTWTAQFPATPGTTGVTIADILAQLDAGSVDTSFSASKITAFVPTTVPEPASLALLGSGLVGLAARARKRRAKKTV